VAYVTADGLERRVRLEELARVRLEDDRPRVRLTREGGRPCGMRNLDEILGAGDFTQVIKL
jgi:hypothetical protein